VKNKLINSLENTFTTTFFQSLVTQQRWWQNLVNNTNNLLIDLGTVSMNELVYFE
jgi:hypothetical protein